MPAFALMLVGAPTWAITSMPTPVPALAGLFGSKPKFLPVHQAFSVSASQSDATLTVRFRVTPEHYVYKDKLKLALPEGVVAGTWQFDSTPSMVDDPEFGRVAVFERDVVATISLDNKSGNAVTAPLTLTWQGCAKAGLCYPPERMNVTLQLPAKDGLKLATGAPPKDEKVADKAVADKASQSNSQNHKSTTGSTPVQTGSAIGASGLSSGSENSSSLLDGRTKSTTPQDGAVSLGSVAKAQTDTSANTDLGANAFSLNNLSADDLHDEALSGNNPQGDTAGDTTTSDALQMGEQADAVDASLIAGAPSLMGVADNEGVMADGVLSANGVGESAKLPHYTLNHIPKVVNSQTFGLEKNPILGVGLLFLAGIALAFTACVYPMIPIVANIVAKSNKPSATQGFVLTSAYGLGVATSYGLLGALVAWFGQGLGLVGWLQNPWVLMAFALLFVVFSLQMAGVLRIGLPVVIKQKLAQGSTLADRYLGSVGGSFLVGSLSALVISPCVSAPMAGALGFVSLSNNVPLGFVALFALGAGLSLPLVVMGTTQGKFMPKAGAWMEAVKQFGALMLLLVAVVLIGRVWSSSLALVVWALWFALMAVFLWRLRGLVLVVLSILSGLWAVLLMVGVGLGASDAWRPLHPLTDKTATATTLPDIKLTNLTALDEVLARSPKVLIEVTAEWCIECRIMERTLFSDRPKAMNDWQFVRLDVTQTTKDSRAVLERYGLFGPPALLYYEAGQLTQVQLGEVSRADFERALQSVK